MTNQFFFGIIDYIKNYKINIILIELIESFETSNLKHRQKLLTV